MPLIKDMTAGALKALNCIFFVVMPVSAVVLVALQLLQLAGAPTFLMILEKLL